MTDTKILIKKLRQEISVLQAKNEELEEYKKKVDQFHSDVTQGAPLAIAFGYPDGRLENCNKAFSQLTGYSLEELQKIDWNKELTPPKWNQNEESILSKLCPENNFVQYEKEYIHKTGRIIPIELSVNAKFNDDNNPLYFIGFVTDITERKQAELLLQDEKENIKTILDLVGNPIFVKDNDHRVIRANSAFYEMFGMDEDSVIGFTLAEAVPENERQNFLKVDRMVLDTGISDEREEELTIGEITRTIITKKTRFIDEAGKRFLVGSIYDITDRKRTEVELKNSEEKFRKAFTTSPDSININRMKDGLYVEINNGFTKIMGYDENEVIGKSSIELRIWENPEERNKLIVGLQTNGVVENLEAKFHSKSGEIKDGLMSANIIELNGEPHILSITRDITKLKQAEEELKKHHDHLAEMVKERTVDLETKNKELDNAMKVFVGRELTIRKLQERIKALEG